MNRDGDTVTGGHDQPLLVLKGLSQLHDHLEKIFFNYFHNMEFYHHKEQVNKNRQNYAVFIPITETILSCL